MKKQKKNNKRKQIQIYTENKPKKTKKETCELIPYIADLTSLFIFSGINSKTNSRHPWRKISQISVLTNIYIYIYTLKINFGHTQIGVLVISCQERKQPLSNPDF